MPLRKGFSFLGLLLFLTPVQAEQPKGSVFLEGTNSVYGLILCHGRGKHPTWKVVEPLRQGVNARLGYHTLSLQMPADKNNFEDYASEFPRAYRIIEKGIQFLRKEKKVERIYLMGHSMGGRMAAAFIARHPEAPITGLIVAGIRNSGPEPLDGKASLSKVGIPVLDIYGSAGNGKDLESALFRKNLVSTRYVQVAIANANHKFAGYEEEFVDAVIQWLGRHN